MKFKTTADATKLSLIRSTHWLINTPENRKYLQSSHNQIMLNPLRKTMFVQEKDFRIALFIDNIAKKRNTQNIQKSPRVQNLSVSGKFKSIRHLAEVLFAKNPDLDVKKWQAVMQKEYPKSESAGIKCYGHYCWYRHHLRINGRFTLVPVPLWFKARVS